MENSHIFMIPKSHNTSFLITIFLTGITNTLKNFTYVPQIKRIMGLLRSREELPSDSIVDQQHTVYLQMISEK